MIEMKYKKNKIESRVMRTSLRWKGEGSIQGVKESVP